jgi:hypothetical protein
MKTFPHRGKQAKNFKATGLVAVATAKQLISIYISFAILADFFFSLKNK